MSLLFHYRVEICRASLSGRQADGIRSYSSVTFTGINSPACAGLQYKTEPAALYRTSGNANAGKQEA